MIRVNSMNKRTISNLILPWILARLLILVKAVTIVITTGKRVAVPSPATQIHHLLALLLQYRFIRDI